MATASIGGAPCDDGPRARVRARGARRRPAPGSRAAARWERSLPV